MKLHMAIECKSEGLEIPSADPNNPAFNLASGILLIELAGKRATSRGPQPVSLQKWSGRFQPKPHLHIESWTRGANLPIHCGVLDATIVVPVAGCRAR